jgi:hypothetical protein
VSGKRTLTGRFFLRDKWTGVEREGPCFSITLEDECCDDHAESGILEILRQYTHAMNTGFESEWTVYRFKVFEQLINDGPEPEHARTIEDLKLIPQPKGGS